MIKYKIHLSVEERAELVSKTKKYKTTVQKYIKAQVLLSSDENTLSEKETAESLSKRLSISTRTVERIRKSFCELGMATFEAKPRKVRSDKKYDARVEAHLIAACCQTPPNGKPVWSLQLLCDHLVSLELLESASCSRVCQVLKKTNLSPFRKSNM